MTDLSQPSLPGGGPPGPEGDGGGCYQPATIWGNPPRTTKVLCEQFLDDLAGEFGCPVACALSLDPVNQLLIPVAFKGIERTALKTFTLRCSDCLSGDAVDRKRISRFADLRAGPDGGRAFQHPDLRDALGLTGMLSIPVLNTANPNQVLLVVNLFAAGGPLPPPEKERRLNALAAGLAVAVEDCLHDRCCRYANRLHITLGRVRKASQDRLCDAVAKLVQQAVACDAAAVYLESTDCRRLDLVGSSNPVRSEERASPPHDSVKECWSRNREALYVELDQGTQAGPGKSRPDEVVSAACVPLQALSGQSRGVIQCLNRCPSVRQGDMRPFTYDDVAVIEAIGRAFSPQLETVQAEQRRTESLNRLAHELRVPVVAFRAVLERVRNECLGNRYTFQFDHFEEMGIYCDVMNRLLKELDIMRRGPQRIALNAQRTYLLRQIIAPACRFVRPLLVKAGFDRNAVNYSGLETIPHLYVDIGLMTQVVFNLLDNAIKYYPRGATDFSMRIEGSISPVGYELLFSDHGIGVEPGDEQLIFEQGVRGSHAHQYDVNGEGIGLWLARAIVRRHGGDLFLRHSRQPTEFVLRLPYALAEGAPPDDLPVD